MTPPLYRTCRLERLCTVPGLWLPLCSSSYSLIECKVSGAKERTIMLKTMAGHALIEDCVGQGMLITATIYCVVVISGQRQRAIVEPLKVGKI